MVIGKRNIETARASFHVLSYLPYQIYKLTLIHQNKHNKKYSISKEKIPCQNLQLQLKFLDLAKQR